MQIHINHNHFGVRSLVVCKFCKTLKAKYLILSKFSSQDGKKKTLDSAAPLPLHLNFEPISHTHLNFEYCIVSPIM